MDAQPLRPEPSRELADLLKRAYGPDADIESDPDALRRLRELEELSRAQVGPEPQPDVPMRDAAPTVPVTPAVAPLGPAEQAAVEPSVPTEWGPRRPRRILVFAVAVVGLVVGVVLAGSAMSLAPTSDSAGASPDVTLDHVSGGAFRGRGFAQNIDYWGIQRGSVTAYESFDTIGVWTGTGNDGSRCLLLSYAGQMFTATCAADGLDPVYDLTVASDTPVRYEGRLLPDRSVIRFTAETDDVAVWVRTASDPLTDLTL